MPVSTLQVVMLVPVWTILPLLAQATPTDSTNTATAIATLVVQLGVSGVFIWLYFRTEGQANKRVADADARAKEAYDHAKQRDDQMITFAQEMSPMIARTADLLGRFEQSVAQQYVSPRPPAGMERIERLLESVLDERDRRAPDA